MRRHLRLFLSQRRSIARRVTGVSMFTAEVLKDGLDFSRDIHLGHLRGSRTTLLPGLRRSIHLNQLFGSDFFEILHSEGVRACRPASL